MTNETQNPVTDPAINADLVAGVAEHAQVTKGLHPVDGLRSYETQNERTYVSLPKDGDVSKTEVEVTEPTGNYEVTRSGAKVSRDPDELILANSTLVGDSYMHEFSPKAARRVGEIVAKRATRDLHADIRSAKNKAFRDAQE